MSETFDQLNERERVLEKLKGILINVGFYSGLRPLPYTPDGLPPLWGGDLEP